jgi:hypothetical protein
MKSQNQQHSQDEQALKVANGGRGRGRGRNSSRGRGRGRQSKDAIECYKCHKLGHYQNECPEWGENANYAQFNDVRRCFLWPKLLVKNKKLRYGS